MTVMPALLQFSFLLTFPCTESFLKESQEDGNVPAVTLAGIAPGWISQAAKGCPRKESAAARPAPGAAEPASPCPLLTSVLQDTVFRGRIDGHRALLPEILHSCDHLAHTTSAQQQLPPSRRKGLLLPLCPSVQVQGDAGSWGGSFKRQRPRLLVHEGASLRQ